MQKPGSYNCIATNQSNKSSTVEKLYKQSGAIGAESSQTTVFRDGTTQWHVAFPPAWDETRDIAMHDDVALGDFFQRPIYSSSFVWDPAAITPFFQAFDPWSAFFNNTRVSNRVSNFKLMSCKLRVKFMVSGNGFYYGRLLAHYDPLSSVNTLSGYQSGATTRTCIQASQGLHAFIDPTESQGCEFTLPFIYPYDALDLTVPFQLSELGSMYVRELQPLKHANGDTSPINITVFIWAEDVKLSVPTTANFVGVTAQSGDYDITPQGDEYGTGPVSMVASAVASAAGKLSMVPVIGRYMRATQMVSGAMGQVARLFGYSRPVAIESSKIVKPDLISKLAVTDVADHSCKLTVDSKQELTIDSSVVGITTPDELTVAYIAGKQSYLTQFPFSTSAAPGTLLWENRVSPMQFDYTTQLWFPTASAWVTEAFGYWRGTVRYRFQVVASAYHRGRLAVTWDPSTMTGTVVPNIVYTKIVDLADERDFTFEVPWGNGRHFLECPLMTSTVPFVSGGVHYPAQLPTCNGVVSVTVLNELTSPSVLVNNDIRINVFTSMCEDVEYAAPRQLREWTYANAPGVQPQSCDFERIVPQGEDINDVVEDSNSPAMPAPTETMGVCDTGPDATSGVYFGETVKSFRSLLKRFNYWGALVSPAATPGTWSSIIADFPPARGYYINGAHVDGANFINYSNMTMINFLAPCFLACRGGIRRKYLLNQPDGAGQTYMRVARLDGLAQTTAYAGAVGAYTAGTPSLRAKERVTNIRSGTGGAAITSCLQQPVLEVELPYYKNERFDSPRQPSGANAVGGTARLHHTLTVDQGAGTTFVDVYVAAAEDFTLIGFQGPPPVRFNQF